jgi:DNA-binding winged helix-turn-helix (wHTH) protein/tetratricopeptide (TPR) repeat protein
MHKPVYRFARFLLDPSARELREGGALVSMPPKSFDCVAYLIEHRARAVGRDELISAVWGSADVSDHTLGQTLLRARQALGDVGAGEREMIRTVPRFGYRWIAAVEVLERSEPVATLPAVSTDRIDDSLASATTEESPETPASSSSSASQSASASAITSDSTPPARSRRGLIIVFLLIALLAVAGSVWKQRQAAFDAEVITADTAPVAAPAAGTLLFMVLPVQLEGDDAATTWVRLGVMDYIATLLRQDAGQAVLPSDQVVTLVGREPARAGDADIGLGRLRAATGATHLVVPRAEHDEARWFIELDVYHDDTLDTYSGSGDAPLAAAAQAVARMLAHLRLNALSERHAPLPDEELLTRIDAALLVGDLAHAASLIERAGPQASTAAHFRVRAGNVAVRQGRLVDAAALYRPVADDAALDNRALRAASWMGLGAVAILQSDNAAAARAYTQAIELLDGSREAGLLGRSYMGRGAAAVALEKFDDATADFGRARIELDRAGDRIGLANLDINVAMAEHNRGRYAAALQAQDRAIAVLAGFGVRDQLVISLHNKVYTQLALLDVAGAVATGEQAMQQVEHLANAAFNRRIAAAYTRALLAAGRLREAAESIERFDAQPDDPAASDTEFAALRLALLAMRGQDGELLAQADAALARIARAADLAGQSMLSETCWLIVQAAVREQRFDTVDRMLAHLEAAPESVQDLDRPVILDLIRAEQIRPQDANAAATLNARALAAAEARGAPEIVITAAVASLRQLLAANDLDAAAAVGGRLAAYADRDYRAARATAALYEALGRPSLAKNAIDKARTLAGERDIAIPY